ncbi:MAG: Stp1/IreP family PP2C-type Ser/Thr phosphatase [Erysipelotrichaceae bacterium]
MNMFGISDKGLVRDQNQDSYFMSYNHHGDFIAVVCDGIGGGVAGDVASKMAVNEVQASFLVAPSFHKDQDVKTWLKDTIKKANDIIFSQSSKSKTQRGMGTTIVGVLITKDKKAYIFNVGDSRTYGYYDELICLTQDHNLVTDLMKAGEIDKAKSLSLPKGNMLTNALGIWDNLKIDINKIKDDYRYLLICSDGLHSYVPEGVISHVLSGKEDVKSKAEHLIELSKKAGGYDNVSVIIIEGENDHE